MILPLQITTKGVNLLPDDEEAIRREALALDGFADRITSCRVTVETPHRHQRTGAGFNVRVDLGLPQGELAVTRQSDTGLLTAVQQAFDAARRQVQDHVQVLRGEVKPGNGPPVATVVKLLPWEGYGFLVDGDGREIYFHRNAVVDGTFDRMVEGMDVRYTESQGLKGPQASTVRPIRRSRKAKA